MGIKFHHGGVIQNLTSEPKCLTEVKQNIGGGGDMTQFIFLLFMSIRHTSFDNQK